MNLNIFEMQLDESKMGDLYFRVQELRGLKNSGKEIVRKVAKEFKKSEKDVEKILLPHALKNVDNMGERELKKVREKYREYFSKAEINRLGNKTFIERLKDRVIAKK